MTAPVIHNKLIEPGLALLPARMDSPEARVMLFAIGLQESRFQHTRQINGPARGYWQFELGGGVAGVLTHPSTRSIALRIAKDRVGTNLHRPVYNALETDLALAGAFARLLLVSDPKPLPALGDAEGAWKYYIRNWRPGKPHPETWPKLYALALEHVTRFPKETA